jgi:eukaryotic-like serine/threonine-protein kinase
MPLSVGEKLGPYEILAPLGAGGMGEVWKARDTRLDRIVAIKQMKAQHLARFEQEARAIAALNHPNICQIYDIGTSPEGFGYLVMEYIEGAPLRGPLPAERALPLAVQIASALENAHARGIVHRDLKPGNILVTAAGQAKLLDFGLAKLTADQDATLTLAISGTPLYMSPEQAEGQPVDQRSDIFSFGAVLYEVLSGRRSFDSLAAVLRDDPASLDSPAAEVVKRCLAKDPGQRFQSMTELRAALEKQTTKPADDHPSIAVLPFANMSRDPDDEYFSDGLAEEIINALAQFPSLKVTARTSAFAFRGKEQDIRHIAGALNVRTILEGSIRRSGNRIRITAQLINAADGYHLWSQRYDREMADVFAVQDEISAAIARALQVRLAGAPARVHQPSLQAYEALLRGRHEMAKSSPDAYRRALAHLQEAVTLDPLYSEPHSELARYFFYLGVWSLRPPREVMPLARAEAQRALELDPGNSMAHSLLGGIAATLDFDWKEAERRSRLAVSAETVPPVVQSGSAVYYVCLGQFDEALRQMNMALEQDPLNLHIRHMLALTLNDAGLFGRAIEEARKIVELEPAHWGAWMTLSHSHAYLGRYAEGLEPAEGALQLAPWNPILIGTLAGILSRLGETARHDQLLPRLNPAANSGWLMYHVLRSDIDAVADCYEKEIESRQPSAPRMASAAWLKPLRSSPRWPKLAKMMDLPGSTS